MNAFATTRPISEPISDRSQVEPIVAQLNFLTDLPNQEVVHSLMGAIYNQSYRERQVIYDQDEEAQFIYVLLKGRVQQQRIEENSLGEKRIILRRTLSEGSVLGKYDLLYRQPHRVRSRALEPCQILAIDVMAVNRLLYQFPKIRQNLAPMERIGRLRTMPFFSKLDLTTLSFLADATEDVTFSAGSDIYRAHSLADDIFVIDEGQVRLNWGSGREVRLGNSMAFGFANLGQDDTISGLMSTLERGHDATAVNDVKGFSLARQVLFEIPGLNPEELGNEQLREMLSTLRRLVVFSEYSAKQRERLLGYMSYTHIAGHHHLIMQQGEIGDSLWVLMPNRRATVVMLNDNGREIAKSLAYGPSYFSEPSLLAPHSRKATVDAEPDSQWLQLHRYDFQAFIHEADGGASERDELLDNLLIDDENIKILHDEGVRQRYEWLIEGERLIHFQRRHWVALVRQSILPALLTAGILMAWIVLLLTPIAPSLRLLFMIPLVVAAIGFWGWGIADYLNDYILVTSQRVVRQEKVLFVNELRQTAYLRQVQNVDTTQTFFGRLMGYGTLNVQTAGSVGSIIFDRVYDPGKIKDVIFRERDVQQNDYRAESKKVILNLLEERLGLSLQMPGRVRPDADARSPDALANIPFWRRYWDRVTMQRYLEFDESDKIVWRKHWFVLIPRLATPLLLLLGTFIAMVLAVSGVIFAGGLPFFAGGAIIIPFVLFGIVAIAWCGWEFADWRNDAYEIDGAEVIDVEKKPLFFSEQRRTARLDDIENVELRVPSPIHYILNFGNVELQTAATDGNLTFDYVPNPRQVAEEIRRRIENLHRQKEIERAKQRAQELPDWFETYNRLDTNRSQFSPSRF